MLKSKRIVSGGIVSLVCLIMFGMVAAGCLPSEDNDSGMLPVDNSPSPLQTETESPRMWTFTDTSGKTITLEIPVQINSSAARLQD